MMAPTFDLETSPEELSEDNRASWIDETSAFDRVVTVVFEQETESASADIAAAAGVSKSTAIKHLERLASLHIVTKNESGSTFLWSRDSMYTAFTEAKSLVAEYDKDELRQARQQFQQSLEEYQFEHGGLSVTEVARSGRQVEIDAETIEQWEETKTNEALAQLALVLLDLRSRFAHR